MARKRDPVPPLEWGAAAFGLIILVILLGIIGRGAFTHDQEAAPLLTVRAERVVATPAGHVVQLAVINRGGVTAASVQVEGVSSGETSIASIDFVPARSSARGGLVFTRAPDEAGVSLRVTGYELP